MRRRTKHAASPGQRLLFEQDVEPEPSKVDVLPTEVLLIIWGNKEENSTSGSPMDLASAVWRAAEHLVGKVPNICISAHNFHSAQDARDRIAAMSNRVKSVLFIVDLERRSLALERLEELESLWSMRAELETPVHLPIVFGRDPDWAAKQCNYGLQLALKRLGELVFVQKAVNSKRSFWVAYNKLKDLAIQSAQIARRKCA